MSKIKAYMNWSGGKDSSLCLHKILKEDKYQVNYLLTSVNKAHNRISMHGVRTELLWQQANSIGIPLKLIELPEQPDMAEYEKEMEKKVNEISNEGIRHTIFGDIFLEDLKKYRENKLRPLGIEGVFPLWKISTKELMKEFLELGFKAIIVCVNGKFLDKSFCGRMIDQSFVNDLPDNVDVCGENGEYHSFVFDGPIFKTPIPFKKGEIVYREYVKPKNSKDDHYNSVCIEEKNYSFYFCDLLTLSNLNMKIFNIQPISKKLETDLKHKIDFKTKPLGALGQLEDIALQIGLIQNTLAPELKNPHIVVFAADHGITNEGVSAYPQEVTFQMVMNFLNGGAAINVFCKQNNINIKVVDAGVNHEFPKGLNVIDTKIGMGTKSFLKEPAMSIKEVQKCIDRGSVIVNEIFQSGCNVIGFGEMGIGNTSSASALMSVVCKLPVQLCVGRGAGLDDEGVQNKIDIIKRAIANNEKPDTPLKTLATFGGFEIAQMCGAMLQAAENKMLILVDGFISTSAFLIAFKINPAILDYAIFCHQSDEQGHAKMLKYLNVKPLLNLNMRLGEGTGAAIGYSVIQSAVNFLNEMASFESAGVSNKEEKELA